MRTKAVIFDMDGVIFDSERLCLYSWEQAIRDYNISDIKQVFMKCIGTNEQATRDIVMNYYGESFNYEFFRKKASVIFHQEEAENGLPVKEGAFELLNYLKENEYKIGLASSTRKEIVEKELSENGLLDFFDVIIGGDMVQHSKPDPEIFLLCQQALNEGKDSCIIVEDSFNGIRAAYAAGIRGIMVPDMLQPVEEIEKLCFKVLNSLSEVLEYLQAE